MYENDTKLILIVGPSGSGKSTLARALADTGTPEIVSHTSRPMRDGEVDGVNYHFITRKQFETRIALGDMIEHVEYNGNLYGVSRMAVDQQITKGNACMVVEAGGARQIKDAYGPFIDVRTFFLFPPEPELLRKRMLARGDKLDVVEKRMATVQEEIHRSLMGDYKLVDYVIDASRPTVELLAAMRSALA